MEIGDRIKSRREELGMSREELAKKVGYKSRSSVNKIETDGRGLPQNKIVIQCVVKPLALAIGSVKFTRFFVTDFVTDFVTEMVQYFF